MSYINDALRKAQSEKNSRYGHYGNMIRTGPVAGKDHAFGRRTIGLAVLVVVLLCGGVAFYVYQNHGAAISVREQPAAHPATGPDAGASPVAERLIDKKWEAPVVDLTAKAAHIYRDALDRQRQGRLTEAATLYEKTLTLDPEHIHALNNLGVIYMSQNKNDQAVNVFTRAIACKKDYVDPYYNLACLYARLNKMDDAFNSLKKAASINVEILEWAGKDADLKNLRKTPDFKSLIEIRGNQ
ncbi:MAG: tetratricopeptide repeat protein [Deltaproteobacteria bacterium]|nr:tetratricopeptide repeat protein [Deltaproteobacteria bacterium]